MFPTVFDLPMFGLGVDLLTMQALPQQLAEAAEQERQQLERDRQQQRAARPLLPLTPPELWCW